MMLSSSGLGAASHAVRFHTKSPRFGLGSYCTDLDLIILSRWRRGGGLSLQHLLTLYLRAESFLTGVCVKMLGD